MSILDYFLDLMYPPRCMLCRKLLKDGEKQLCSGCAQRLPGFMTNEPRWDIKNVKLCYAPFQYKDEVRASLHRYKFGGAAAYGPIYADFILKSIDENPISCDIISWVPLSPKRYRKRGYDQAEIIARALAEKLGLPCEKLLVKIKDNPKQSSIGNRERRKANVAGVYRCASENMVSGKRLLIIDDIVTSGATLAECAAVLRKSGCIEVYAAAAASRT